MQSAIAQSTLRAEEEPWGTEKPEAFSVDRRAFSTSHGSLPSKFVGKLKNLYFFFFLLSRSETTGVTAVLRVSSSR